MNEAKTDRKSVFYAEWRSARIMLLKNQRDRYEASIRGVRNKITAIDGELADLYAEMLKEAKES